MEDVKNVLKSYDVGALISEMVKIRSYSFMKDQEREIARGHCGIFPGREHTLRGHTPPRGQIQRHRRH